MDYNTFLNAVIDRGILAAKIDYRDEHKRKGAIQGFEACRGKNPVELGELLRACAASTFDAYKERRDDYWYFRCYELEVEWVCNCVSATLMNQGLPTIITPTARGVLMAVRIVGVEKEITP